MAYNLDLQYHLVIYINNNGIKDKIWAVAIILSKKLHIIYFLALTIISILYKQVIKDNYCF